MNKLFTCFLIAVVFKINLAQEDENVITLNSSTFIDTVSQHPNILILFYAPWCQHCKKFAPHFNEVAKLIKSQNLNIVLGKIDVSEEKSIGDIYDIKTYPTLKLFKNTNQIDYKGVKDSQYLTNWVIKQILPNVIQVNSTIEVENIIDKFDVVVVLFLKEQNEQKLNIFQQVSQDHDNIFFIYTIDSEIRGIYNVDDNIDIILFRKFDDPRFIFSETFNQENLSRFLSDYSHPLIMQFNHKMIDLIFNKKKSAIILFVQEQNQDILIQFESVAALYRGYFKFLVVNSKESTIINKIVEYFGVKITDFPMLILINPDDNNAKYKFQGEINFQNLRDFISKFQDEKLEKYLKSQDPPEQNDDLIKTVVGSTFQKIVLDSSEDVLLLFYANWCSHCKKMLQLYQKIAQTVKENQKLIVAKIDASSNEIQQIQVLSYPTLIYFKNGQKEYPIVYKGEKTEVEILNFIMLNYSHEWQKQNEIKSDL